MARLLTPLTPHLQGVVVSVGPDGVTMRFQLSRSPARSVVANDPPSGAKWQIIDEQTHAVRRGNGFIQIQLADECESLRLEVSWPDTADEFRLLLDAPTIGLETKALVPAPRLALTLHHNESAVAAFVGPSPDAILGYAATLVKQHSVLGSLCLKSAPVEEDESSGFGGSGTWEESVSLAANKLKRVLATPIDATVVRSRRSYDVVRDFDSLGVLHSNHRTDSGKQDLDSSLLLDWELSSLWWGGSVQGRSSESIQILLALRMVTTVLVNDRPDSASNELESLLQDGFGSVGGVWDEWIKEVVSVARTLLLRPRGQLTNQLRQLQSQFRGKILQASHLRLGLGIR